MKLYKYNKNDIGIDEAGRGPFFGPVFAAAVIWGDAKDNELIQDSKKLSQKKRKLAYEWIKSNIKNYSIGMATVEEIDKLNILEATKLAMSRALEGLNYENNNILIDGCYWERKFNQKVESIIKGDTLYSNIAAASIIAKEAHDEYILELCNKDTSLNENYDIANNKGYGTKKHRLGIKNHGLTQHHRKSFKI